MGGGVRDRGAKTWGRKKRLVRIRVAGCARCGFWVGCSFASICWEMMQWGALGCDG